MGSRSVDHGELTQEFVRVVSADKALVGVGYELVITALEPFEFIW